ncbi:MAG: acriflavin resistance protein [Parcubacteria group bacterium Gr01-1014_8]|nr:MAG: acriflavin resistance protein [Parcubacteria group bacterium Gr01-1014_8]
MLPLWTFFLKKRQFTVLLVVSLIAAGTYALLSIPKESAPEVRIPVGIVSVVLPGGSAEDVEQLITNEIETAVANLENLDTLTSSSRESISIVTVQFDASADLDKSIQDLKDAIDQVKPNLPEEANDPVVSEINFSEQPVLIISVTGEYPPSILTKLGDDIKEELQNVDGVSRVEVSGVRKRQIHVIVQKDKLEQYGLRLGDVTGAIQASNASLPVGSITVNSVEYALNFEGDLTKADQVRDVAILTQSGSIVYIRDIADIVDGLQKPTSISRASKAGEPSQSSLTLSVFKSSGGNIVATADAIKERLDELQSGMLAGSTVVVALDLGEEVNKDLTELTSVGFETMILVMLTLFITIGWRESLVAAASIPLSFLIAFIGLQASGNTINFVSLFALILAIGILVDSGIVVTEAIHTRMRRYPTKDEAAAVSLREYAWPLMSGTMASVAVFAPLFFISGIVGEFIASIPFTLIFVLVASIFVALGIVPLIAIALTTKESNRLEQKQEEYTHRFQEWYRMKLSGLLDSRRAQNIFLWSIAGAFILSMLLPITGLLRTTFFPQEDIDFIFAEIEKPRGTALEETDLAVRIVEESLYGNPDIEAFTTTTGGSSALTGDAPTSGGHLANITILLKKNRTKTSSEVVEDIRKSVGTIPGTDVRIQEPNNGPPSGSPVLITFSGDDLDQLESAALKAENILSSIEGVSDIQSSVKDNGLEFSLSIDRAKAASLGLSPVMIAQTLRTAVQGQTATTIRNAKDDIDVVVKLDLNPLYDDPSETTIISPDALRAISIPTPRGPVLLGSVLDTSIHRGKSSISHDDRKRIETVSSQVSGGKTAVEVTNEFEARIDELELPEGVTWKAGGETEDVNKSFAEMGIAFIAGLLLMIAIMVLQFNSLRHALYLILMVILSLIGVFGGLFLTAQTLSFSSVIGIIALAGVIINHAIILTDSIHRLLQTRHDLSHRDIIVEAAVSRLRPIFLTTLTTVIGMAPLAGASALWGPLAFAIMFGLAFSMILTLVMIPILTYRWPGSWKIARQDSTVVQRSSPVR